MALANYTDLTNALSDWLARSDLTSRIPDFITLAEARLNRGLRTRDMEATGTITITAGSGAYPAGYLEWIVATWLNASGANQDLRYVEPDAEEWRLRFRPNVNPQMFTILAGKVFVRPWTAGNVSLLYYTAIPSLQVNTTNWLMTKYPDVYLNYSLAEAYIYTKDQDRAAQYLKMGAESAAKAVQDADSNKIGRRPNRQPESDDIMAARNPNTDGL